MDEAGAPEQPDVRRAIPRTDVLLRDPLLAERAAVLGTPAVKRAINAAQDAVRQGEIEAGSVVPTALAALSGRASLRPVINATGVVLHTNLGRAPLSPVAVEALVAASGTTDVELDLDTGRRARRGRGTLAALRSAVPDAEDVHVVNNGAAALLLTALAFAAGREIVVSRGELVEIGDGFRIPALIESTGARLREVGTTNRTTLGDYRDALGPQTALILKVHPSNFVVTGFTASVPVAELACLPVPLVVDIGSGLLQPERLLPDEPDATTALRDGAAMITSSGDKLLGGPQCGLLLGRVDLIDRLRRHPAARALRVDKLTLAALEATLAGPPTPTYAALHADLATLQQRAQHLARMLNDAGVAADAVDSDGVVGGGGAPGVVLPSAAVAVAVELARPLRLGEPAVVGRADRGRLLLDLRCVPAASDHALIAAVVRVSG